MLSNAILSALDMYTMCSQVFDFTEKMDTKSLKREHGQQELTTVNRLVGMNPVATMEGTTTTEQNAKLSHVSTIE